MARSSFLVHAHPSPPYNPVIRATSEPDSMHQLTLLVEELTDYLPERYPSLFQRTAVGINNLLTGESFNIVERPLAEDPMQICGRLVQDDLAIMFEREDGQYYLLAGAILLAGFWRLEDKLGMPLSEIHTSGDVPGFKEKLEKGMLNFFRRVMPDGPVQRVCFLSPTFTRSVALSYASFTICNISSS
jgi:hypothetical protein